MLAVYGDVLGLWSKNNDFAISLAQFNRTPYHPEVNQIVGDFTSIMILDLHPHLDKVFTNRASMVQKTLWENLEHRAFDGVQVLREMARGKRSAPGTGTSCIYQYFRHGRDSEELYPWAVLGEVGYFVSQTPQVWLDNQVSEQGRTYYQLGRNRGVIPFWNAYRHAGYLCRNPSALGTGQSGMGL